jgi:hypothetical protein
MGDNHGANDVLCRSLESRFTQPWDALQHRLRCIGHIINLAVQAFLFDQDLEALNQDTSELDDPSSEWRQRGTLGKLHNIAVHIRGSPTRYQEFVAIAGKSLPLNNATRWNSWYTLLKTALEISGSIHTYLEKWINDLADDYLDRSNWETLKEIAAFLGPFYRATLAAEGAQGTLDQVLLSMDALTQHYEHSYKRFAKSSIQQHILRSWEVFDKYYAKTEAVSIYAAALILHPSRRLSYIKKNWKKEWQKPAFTGVKKLWEEYSNREVREDFKSPSDSELDDYDKLIKKLEVIDVNTMDEYEAYTHEKAIIIRTSALTWWLSPERCTAYPRLSQMAIDVLSIPAMSDEPERVFSGARRTISWDRARLGVSTIERTQCLKSWVASGVVSSEIEGVEEVEGPGEGEGQGSGSDRDCIDNID